MNVFDLALDSNDKEWFTHLHKVVDEMNTIVITDRGLIIENVAKYYLNNYKVTSKFGESRGASTHAGLDLVNGKKGESVKSLMTGVIAQAYYSKTGGYMVVVEQSDGTVAKYMHMQKELKVKQGDKVEAGTELGKVGNSGNAFFPYLHIQIEQNGEKIDPLKYLNELASSN